MKSAKDWLQEPDYKGKGQYRWVDVDAIEQIQLDALKEGMTISAKLAQERSTYRYPIRVTVTNTMPAKTLLSPLFVPATKGKACEARFTQGHAVGN